MTIESGFQTPLLDVFRRGDVPRDIRELAARGALDARDREQLALLVLLVADHDAEIARLAETTLGRIPADSLAAFLARADTSEQLRGFFHARGITPAAEPSADDAGPLLRVDVDEADADEAGAGEAKPEQSRRLPLSMLPVTERLKLAMKGTREQRASLIRDANKMVAIAVLSSPKLAEPEIEAFARMANVSEEVLRVIGTARAWTKKYTVISALTRNPKTPPAISLTLLSRLNERDVKVLATDRNVTEPLRVAARKILAAGLARRR